MATIRPHRNFEIRDNLETIAGVTLTWKLSSEPAVPHQSFEDERNLRGLGSEYSCPALTASTLFGRECRNATRSFLGGSGRTHKITALPPHEDSDAINTSFVVGRKGSAVGANAIHIGRVRLALSTGRVSWTFTDFYRDIGETSEAYIERRLSTLPMDLTAEDVDQFVHVVNHIAHKVQRFTDCVDVHSYRGVINKVLRKLPAFHISHGSWFIPSDTRAGDQNPVLVVEDLKKLIEAVNPLNRVYLIPIFPSADAVSAAADGAADSIDAKIIELSDKLEAVAEFTRANSGETWAAKWKSLEAEAALYQRLLGMQQRDFAERISKARAAVEEKARALFESREAAELEKQSKREKRASERAAKKAELEKQIAVTEPKQSEVTPSLTSAPSIRPSLLELESFTRRVRSCGSAEAKIAWTETYLLGWMEGGSVVVTIKNERTGAMETTEGAATFETLRRVLNS